MGLKYYSEEVDRSKLLSSVINIPIYANISVSHLKPQQCPSRPSSSEIPTNIYPHPSIQKQDGIVPSTQSANHLSKNIYANIPILSSKATDIPNESTYATLINTTSTTPPITVNVQTADENNNTRFYENINSYLTPHHRTNNVNISSSSHIYINLDHQKGAIIPARTKTPSPKTDRKDELQFDHEPNILETNSNTNTIEMVKKLELNMAPNCGDKSILYRTKIPTIILPPFRQRRTLTRSKRHRRRSVVNNSNSMRRHQHSNTNVKVHRPIVTHEQRKHSLHKNQQTKSVMNDLYNELQQSTSVHPEQHIEIFQYPFQYHGALQHQIFPWCQTENYNEEESIPQVFSSSENGTSDQQDETTNEEEDVEEEKELSLHKTSKDLQLYRHSTCSSSTVTSDTETVTSETISREIPTRPLDRRLPDIALGLDKKDVDFIHDILQRTDNDDHLLNRITALREAYIRATNKRNALLRQKSNSELDKKKTAAMKQSFIASKIRDELEKYDELPAHQQALSDDDTYSANDDHRPAVPSTVHRILNFITSLKRQLQKNFQEIRSRILIEAMANPSNHVSRHRNGFQNSSDFSRRHMSRPKTTHNIVHGNNSHQSTEHPYPINRHQLHRAHSNTSKLQSQHQHFHPLPPVEQYSSRRERPSRITPHQQRLQRK